VKIADRYIFRELIWPMLFGIAAFVSILVAGRPLMELTKLAFEGVPTSDVFKLFLLSLPALIVLTLPMSMLLSTLLGFGRLSGNSEMVAMYAGGLSLYRATVPVLFLALVITGVTIALNEKVVPWSIDTAAALRTRIEGQVKTQKEVELRLPQYNNTKLTGIIRADRFAPRTGAMENVSVTYFDTGEPTRIVFAKSATRKDDLHWILRDGWYHDLKPDAKTPTGYFQEWDITIQQTLAEMRDQSKKPTEMSMAQLRRYIAVLNRQGQITEIPQYEVAWWNHLAVPFAAVVFALIGVPLGIRPQRASGGLGLGLSIVIIFAYWVVWDYSSKIGGLGTLPPFVASWLANIMGLGIGGFLLARAPK
jgi:lipopolysaccharide export system permease protein